MAFDAEAFLQWRAENNKAADEAMVGWNGTYPRSTNGLTQDDAASDTSISNVETD